MKRFKLTNALFITKLSRFEYEQYRHPTLSKTELQKVLRNRGTDYELMLHFHNVHKNFVTRVSESFRKYGISVKTANRFTITKELIHWADLLVPIGGDGTFLMAAGRASPIFTECGKTPIVGFNSDPKRSEGQLMLPSQYSDDPDMAVEKIVNNKFEWLQRSRIRLSLFGPNGNTPRAVDLHEHDHVPIDDLELETLTETEAKKYDAKVKRTLPYLALNEVFIGETLSARVSHVQIQLENTNTYARTKCSGLCVSTGTGSTSWHKSINRLSSKNVKDLLEIVKRKTPKVDFPSPEEISNEYNKELVFPPDDPRLCYSIREQIHVGVWPDPKNFDSRGFAKHILVRSCCVDASLVIDGSIAYPFNDGAKVLLESNPADALLTVTL